MILIGLRIELLNFSSSRDGIFNGDQLSTDLSKAALFAEPETIQIFSTVRVVDGPVTVSTIFFSFGLRSVSVANYV